MTDMMKRTPADLLESFGNPQLKLAIDPDQAANIGLVQAMIDGQWVTVAVSAADDGFFQGDLADVECKRRRIEHDDGAVSLEITRTSDQRGMRAVQTVTIRPGEALIHRRHHYTFTKGWEGAVHPGWRIPMDSAMRYTLPIHAHEVPLAQVEPLRADATWTLPVPMHLWHNRRYLVGYGVKKPGSQGTLDLHPTGDTVEARLYYPERCDHPLPASEQLFKPAPPPTTIKFARGRSLTIEDVLWVTPLTADQEPLFEAMRHTARLILQPARPPVACERATLQTSPATHHDHVRARAESDDRGRSVGHAVDRGSGTLVRGPASHRAADPATGAAVRPRSGRRPAPRRLLPPVSAMES